MLKVVQTELRQIFSLVVVSIIIVSSIITFFYIQLTKMNSRMKEEEEDVVIRNAIINEIKVIESEKKKAALKRKGYTEKYLLYIVELMKRVDKHGLVNSSDYHRWELDLLYIYETINIEMKDFSLQFYVENRTNLTFYDTIKNYVKLLNEVNDINISPVILNVDQIIKEQSLIIITKVLVIVSTHKVDLVIISPEEIILKCASEGTLKRIYALAWYYRLKIDELEDRLALNLEERIST